MCIYIHICISICIYIIIYIYVYLENRSINIYVGFGYISKLPRPTKRHPKGRQKFARNAWEVQRLTLSRSFSICTGMPSSCQQKQTCQHWNHIQFDTNCMQYITNVLLVHYVHVYVYIYMSRGRIVILASMYTYIHLCSLCWMIKKPTIWHRVWAVWRSALCGWNKFSLL